MCLEEVAQQREVDGDEALRQSEAAVSRLWNSIRGEMKPER